MDATQVRCGLGLALLFPFLLDQVQLCLRGEDALVRSIQRQTTLIAVAASPPASNLEGSVSIGAWGLRRK